MVNIEDLKLPPNHIEAEKWLIWSILLDNESMYIVDWISILPDDFYDKWHVLIFEQIKALWDDRKTIDVITLSNGLSKSQNLETIWWIDYLYELSTFVITATSAWDYAKIVKEKSVLRRILKVTQQVSWDVYQENDVPTILEKIEKRIFDLTQINVSDSLIHIKDLLSMRFEEYVEIANDPTKLEKTKILSWFEMLDNLAWWFKPWELIILAARPSMWKTSFALNILINSAIKQKKACAIFSLEMGSEQIVDRILSSIAEIPLYKIHKWKMEEYDFDKIWNAMEKIWDTNIYIDDKWWATIKEMKSKLRRLKIEKWALDFVIVDYLQLMSWSTSSFWNRVQEISEISRWLKEMARELEIPILSLSQLSRAVEQRPDKRPQLSDLRESWAIEQDADMVLMLYRDEYYDQDTDKKWEADIYIRKNRNWPTWEVSLMFVKETMSFFTKANEDMYD